MAKLELSKQEFDAEGTLLDQWVHWASRIGDLKSDDAVADSFKEVADLFQEVHNIRGEAFKLYQQSLSNLQLISKRADQDVPNGDETDKAMTAMSRFATGFLKCKTTAEDIRGEAYGLQTTARSLDSMQNDNEFPDALSSAVEEWQRLE